MNTVDLIQAKRDGHALSSDQIHELIRNYTHGHVPDYQMAAWLMASFLNGMQHDEMTALTHAMLHSGTVLDLSDVPGTKVDKHSTGGVGDKVSIPLAPIVAACGVPVPMISGRGLGHTGGTLDKLESIPGFRTDLDIASYRRQLADIGLVMIGQTAEIAPADKKLYALRDVTSTVEFIPFIAASILSKKLAEGIDALVLDVKHGSGAFMQKEEDARRLAETLVGISESFGKPTVALLTDMDQPLGRCAGNWPEVAESIELLQGGSPADLQEVTFALAGEMLAAGGVASNPEEGVAMAQEAVANGKAMDRFLMMVEQQGGDTDAVRDPLERSRHAVRHEVYIDGAEQSISRIDARTVGRAMVTLGAGRQTKEDDVDPLAGVELLVRAGESVSPGSPIARIWASTPDRIEAATDVLRSAYEMGSTESPSESRLTDRYTNGAWQG